jgi:hypothetical protein
MSDRDAGQIGSYGAGPFSTNGLHRTVALPTCEPLGSHD